MENEIKIIDESGDKKYFTIIPNYIYNHSTLYDREVYCQMKRIAGDNGTCWMSQKNLAKQCGISINRLKKSVKYLTDHKWIKFNGKKIIKTTGGEQEVNEYSISDLWKLNNDFYDKGVSPDDTPSSKGVSLDDARGVTNELKGVSPDDDKEEPLNNNNKEDIVGKADEEFILLEENKKLLSDPKRHIQIIGIWLKAKASSIENKKQLQSFIKRNLRPAQLLDGYSNQRIIEVIKYLKENADFKFTLESVSKFIDEDLNKLNSNKILSI